VIGSMTCLGGPELLWLQTSSAFCYSVTVTMGGGDPPSSSGSGAEPQVESSVGPEGPLTSVVLILDDVSF